MAEQFSNWRDLPQGLYDGANRYSTDSEEVLSLWRAGEIGTWDLREPRREFDGETLRTVAARHGLTIGQVSRLLNDPALARSRGEGNAPNSMPEITVEEANAEIDAMIADAREVRR